MTAFLRQAYLDSLRLERKTQSRSKYFSNVVGTGSVWDFYCFLLSILFFKYELATQMTENTSDLSCECRKWFDWEHKVYLRHQLYICTSLCGSYMPLFNNVKRRFLAERKLDVVNVLHFPNSVGTQGTGTVEISSYHMIEIIIVWLLADNEFFVSPLPPPQSIPSKKNTDQLQMLP